MDAISIGLGLFVFIALLWIISLPLRFLFAQHEPREHRCVGVCISDRSATLTGMEAGEYAPPPQTRRQPEHIPLLTDAELLQARAMHQRDHRQNRALKAASQPPRVQVRDVERERLPEGEKPIAVRTSKSGRWIEVKQERR